MKTFLLFILLFVSAQMTSQVFALEEEFNGGTTAPSGWTFTSVGGTYTSNANYGKSSPSLQIDATNDRIQTASWTGSADQVTFMMRAQGTPNNTDAMLVEGWNGSAWTTIGTARPITTARVYVMSLGSTITQLRFTYTKGASNVAFDDVAVRYSNMCTGTSLQLGMIMADACDAGTSCEGMNEFIAFQNGSVAMNISDFEITYPDVGTSGGDTYCSTVSNAPCNNTITTNTTYVSSLNTTAGCTVFSSPPSGVIPANANVIIFSGSPPNFTWDFSSLCAGGATYYAIFANNTSDCNGRFGNQSSCSGSACWRDVFIRNRATGCTDTAGYNRSAIGTSDGAYASFNLATSTLSYGSSSCNTLTILPLLLTSFSIEETAGGELLNWSLSADPGSEEIKIEKSYDGLTFFNLSAVPVLPNVFSYQYTDQKSLADVYYRLKCVEENGRISTSEIIVAKSKRSTENGLSIVYTNEGPFVCIQHPERKWHLRIYNPSGTQVLDEAEIKDSPVSLNNFRSHLERGFYIVSCQSGEEFYTCRLIIF